MSRKQNCVRQSRRVKNELRTYPVKDLPEAKVMLRGKLKRVRNLTRKNKKNYVNDYVKWCTRSKWPIRR